MKDKCKDIPIELVNYIYKTINHKIDSLIIENNENIDYRINEKLNSLYAETRTELHHHLQDQIAAFGREFNKMETNIKDYTREYCKEIERYIYAIRNIGLLAEQMLHDLKQDI